jgi:hypothetical protein
MNWGISELKEFDPIVRFYVKRHSYWTIVRGAHGGIVPRENYDKKSESKSSRNSIKNQLKAAIESGKKVSNSQYSFDEEE